MKVPARLSAVVLCTGLVFSLGAARAQEKPATDKKKAKQEQKQQQRLRKELGGEPYRMTRDGLSYIISEEELATFNRLSTNEEREQFIEQFWLRRDPTPDTVENEFREEHYRRIAYANERFASGIPGWKTDRGRIYIIWGPADEIESHPSGGSYHRPHEEGGGSTATFPFEKWRYRRLEGLGNDIQLEFVDPSGSGEYRLTMDPQEKDALKHVPGAGLTELEAQGLVSRAQRLTGQNPALGFQSARNNPFDKMTIFVGAQRPPAFTKYKDLEQLVTSRIVRDQIRFDYRFDFLRVTTESVLVPITVQIPNRQLAFNSRPGVHSATLNLFARITTLSGRVVQTFEDVIQRDIPEALLRDSLAGSSIYQKAVPLRPGLYRLDLVIKDVNSGDVGTLNARLPVPRYQDRQLASSTLILADQVERVPAGNIGLGQFVLGASRVRPRLAAAFTSADKLGIYLQIYNLQVDAAAKPSATFEYRIVKGTREVAKFIETTEQMKARGEQVTIEKLVSLEQLQPGEYTLEITVTDHLANASITPSARFTVKAAEKPAAATR